MLLILALVLCAAVTARLVARYDLYDKEPWYMVATAIAAGAVAMAAAGPLEDRAIRWIGAGQPTFADIAAVAASVEELARLGIVLAIALLVPRHFNDPMDGLVYGSAAGIGMALEETTLQLARETGLPLSTVLAGELVRLFGHVIMGGITGFGVGMMRRHPSGRSWMAIAAGCLLAGVAIHFGWDFFALSAMDPDSGAWPVPASVVLMLVSVGLYGVLVVRGSRLSRRVFAPHSRVRVWGTERSGPDRS